MFKDLGLEDDVREVRREIIENDLRHVICFNVKRYK